MGTGLGIGLGISMCCLRYLMGFPSYVVWSRFSPLAMGECWDSPMFVREWTSVKETSEEVSRHLENSGANPRARSRSN